MAKTEYREPRMRWNTGLLQYEPDLEGGPPEGRQSLRWFWILTAVFLAMMLLLLLALL